MSLSLKTTHVNLRNYLLELGFRVWILSITLHSYVDMFSQIFLFSARFVTQYLTKINKANCAFFETLWWDASIDIDTNSHSLLNQTLQLNNTSRKAPNLANFRYTSIFTCRPIKNGFLVLIRSLSKPRLLMYQNTLKQVFELESFPNHYTVTTLCAVELATALPALGRPEFMAFPLCSSRYCGAVVSTQWPSSLSAHAAGAASGKF